MFDPDLAIAPVVTGFFDPATNTVSYVVQDPARTACAIIDSVMDFDYAAGRISYDHANEIAAFVQTQGLRVDWLIETHVHADHLSAAPYLQGILGGKSTRITAEQVDQHGTVDSNHRAGFRRG